MDKLFLQVINMSITSCYVILFVILIRLFLKKAPKIFSYSLWSVVLLRLTFPFSFQSIFSVIPINTKSIPEDIMYAQVPQINSGITVIDHVVNNSLPAPVLVSSVNPMQIWIGIGQTIWIIGLIGLTIYSIVATLRLAKNLKSAIHISDNIYLTNNIKTPFLFGLIKPKIYLPTNLSETEKVYIIKHEQTHIERSDHIIKFVGFLVLSFHWFNPLVWVAFFLMSNDMELSCDEKVIKEMGNGIKKDYSNSLLSLSTGRRIIGGSPIAFGENNTKGRIENILNYKKAGFWITMVSVIILIAVGVGLLGSPKGDLTSTTDIMEAKTVEDYAEEFVEEIIKGYESRDGYSGGFKIIESKIISLEKVASFDDILSTPVEIWSLEYRLKPGDMNDVMLAGGMEEIDGWLTDNGSMGKPMLAFIYEGDVTKYLGPVYTAELYMNTLAGQETAIRSMLENNNILPNETYKGNHIVMKFPLSTGETCQALLSQPVVQGSKGIWAVERWMDGNGTIYYEYPQTDIKIGDYYKNLQQQFDNSQSLPLGDPAEVGYDFIRNGLGQTGVKKRDLIIKESATVEDFMDTPVSHYIGYITKFGLEDRFFHIDTVEFLGSKDVERLKELNIDSNKLDNGFYIHNPTNYPNSLFVTDETEYIILNWEDLSVGEIVTKSQFIEYLEGDNNYDPIFVSLFHVYTKNGDVIRIEEQYLP